MKSVLHKIHKILLGSLPLVLLLLPQITLAATITDTLNSTVNTVFQMLSMVMSLLQILLWPILLLIGALFSNDLLFSGGMGVTLLGIWSVVRDFTNIIMVIALVFVAIYNISGMAKDAYLIKTFLPKMAIALIAVNFSFLAGRVVLDITNVMTTAILAIPVNLSQDLQDLNQNQPGSFGDKLCKSFAKLAAYTPAKSATPAKPAKPSAPAAPSPAPAESQNINTQLNQICEKVGGGPVDFSTLPQNIETLNFQLTQSGKNLFARFNQRNIALILAVQLMDLTKIDQVNVEQVKDLKTLTIGIMYSVVFFVIYAAAFVALFIALLARVVALWIAIATSPLIFLGMTLPAAKNLSEGNESIRQVFIDNALMPIKLALVLSLGVIMVTSLKNIQMGSSVLGFNVGELGGVSATMNLFQDIIVGLGVTAFIWKGVKMAFEKGAAAGIIKNMLGQVEKFGTDLAKTPLYAPIIPVAGGKQVGVAALGAALNKPEQYISSQKTEYQKLYGNTSAAAEEVLSQVKTGGVDKMKQALSEIASSYNYSNKTEWGSKIAAKLRNDPKMTSAFKGAAKSATNLEWGPFLDRLEKGEISPDQFQSFIREAKIPSAENKHALEMAESALSKAKEARKSNVQKVTLAAGNLEQAANKLKTAVDEGKEAAISAARAALITAEQDLEKARNSTPPSP